MARGRTGVGPACSWVSHLVTWRGLVLGGLVLAGVALGTPVAAAELGHYVPGVFNIRDFVLPPKGFYGAIYSLYYSTSDLRDRNGDRVRSIDIAGRRIEVDLDLDLYSVAPTVIWNTGWKILGADYGLYASVPFGRASVGAALTLESGFGREVDESASGLQDILLQPVWLGWSWPSADLSVAYAFYAPTGHFEPGDPDNIGLGFWTHQVQVGGAYYFFQRATAVVLAATYEIHHKKEDVDITPGSHLSLNYGLSQYLPVGPGLAELGVLGYSQWQVTDDSGGAVRSDRDVHDQVHAVGAQVGYVIPKWQLAISGKYLYEYYAEARFRGHVATLSASYQF